jgi:hypothetical protein
LTVVRANALPPSISVIAIPWSFRIAMAGQG